MQRAAFRWDAARCVSVCPWCPVTEIHNKTEAVILSERGPERLSVRGW